MNQSGIGARGLPSATGSGTSISVLYLTNQVLNVSFIVNQSGCGAVIATESGM